MAFTSVAEIKDAEEQHRFAAEAYLRAKGWKHTSSTVGCYWMWERVIGAVTYRLEFESALRTQGIIEADESGPNDEDPEA